MPTLLVPWLLLIVTPVVVEHLPTAHAEPSRAVASARARDHRHAGEHRDPSDDRFREDCAALRALERLAQLDDEGAAEPVRAQRVLTCAGVAAAPHTWPTGRLAKTSGGTWYWPNGRLALTSGGTWYWPGGRLAKTQGSTWYWPNGRLARTGSGTWYSPDGRFAHEPALLGDACQRAGDECEDSLRALRHATGDERVLLVLDLVWRGRA